HGTDGDHDGGDGLDLEGLGQGGVLPGDDVDVIPDDGLWDGGAHVHGADAEGHESTINGSQYSANIFFFFFAPPLPVIVVVVVLALEPVEVTHRIRRDPVHEVLEILEGVVDPVPAPSPTAIVVVVVLFCPQAVALASSLGIAPLYVAGELFFRPQAAVALASSLGIVPLDVARERDGLLAVRRRGRLLLGRGLRDARPPSSSPPSLEVVPPSSFSLFRSSFLESSILGVLALQLVDGPPQHPDLVQEGLRFLEVFLGFR
ncbi:hypothetical protein ACHAWF_009862, partial [Thalassiosira exigua]